MHLTAATDKLHGPLNALAIVKVIDAFYTPEQRTALLKQIDEAYAACHVAYEAIKAGTPTEPGKTEAQKAEHQRLFNEKMACDHVVDGLKREHKLLFRLREAKATLSKGKYD